MNKRTRTSLETGNNSNLYFNVNMPQWSEAISSEEEDVGMRKYRRKNNVEIKNEEVKGKSSKSEEIKILKCSRKSHVENINEEMKGRSSKEEEIGILKCRGRSRVEIMNEELKGWTS